MTSAQTSSNPIVLINPNVDDGAEEPQSQFAQTSSFYTWKNGKRCQETIEQSEEEETKNGCTQSTTKTVITEVCVWYQTQPPYRKITQTLVSESVANFCTPKGCGKEVTVSGDEVVAGTPTGSVVGKTGSLSHSGQTTVNATTDDGRGNVDTESYSAGLNMVHYDEDGDGDTDGIATESGEGVTAESCF